MKRHQLSGHQKRQKKIKAIETEKRQIGSLDKFFGKNNPKNANIGVVDEDINIREQPQAIPVESEQEIENQNVEAVVENDAKEVDAEIDIEEIRNNSIDYDPGTWEKIDQRLRDLLVKKGPIRIVLENFPKDSSNRHFSSMHYRRVLPNGDIQDRKWLVYSLSSNKVFCFCCKLFKYGVAKTKFVEDGIDD